VKPAGAAPANLTTPTPQVARTSVEPDEQHADQAFHRLDALFGTTGDLPGGKGQGRILEFVRHRMAQSSFYDTVLRHMFKMSLSWDGGVAINVLKEGSDAAGPFLYRFTPCPPRERVNVRPWWSFDGSEVSVCKADYQPKAQTATINGAVFYCETPGVYNLPGTGCGCGDHLISCAPQSIADKVRGALVAEPVRTAEAIVRGHRPFSELMTANATVRSGWADYFYARSRLFATGKLEFAEPEDPIRATSRPRPPEYTGGILTTAALRFWETPRKTLSSEMQEFLCIPDVSQEVKASETLKLTVSSSQQGLFYLASRTGCQNCHARLENAMRAFSAYPYALFGVRYIPTNVFEGQASFFLRDHTDQRATGTATPEWFGKTLSMQPEFSECVTRKVENLIYAGYRMPQAAHERLLKRFREHLDFADLVEQVVLAWFEADVPHGEGMVKVAPEPDHDPTAATDALHRLLGAHCTGCHHDGANIPSFEDPRALGARRILRIGLYVDAGRMPPNKPLEPQARKQIVQSVCTMLGDQACQHAFGARDDLPVVRSPGEFLRTVEQATKRPLPSGGSFVQLVERFDPNEPRHNVTTELERVLLTTDQCPDDHGSNPTAMRSCIETTLSNETLRTLSPPSQTGGAR
jgi:hypothetical protein